MKFYLFAAVSALALVTGAAHAATVPNGYAGASYSYTNGSDKGSENDGGGAATFGDKERTNAFNLEAAAALPITHLIGAQVDVGYGNIWTRFRETFDDGADTDAFSGHNDGTTATAHLFARTDNWLAGAFVGEEALGGGRYVGGGLEGQYYYGHWTFGGSVGAAKETSDFLEDNGPKPYVWAGRIDARYFFTDNLSVTVNGGYLQGHFDDGSAGDFETIKGPKLWTVGVGAEYRIGQSPFTLLASYEHGEFTTDESFDAGADTDHDKFNGDALRVGFRWTFGGSLLDRDRHGASLNTFKQSFGDEFGDTTGGFEGVE